MSLLVEARFEKPEILEAYLNEIYLGQRGPTSIHGVGEASLFYFGKPLRSLRLEDAALLAGLIRSPGDYSPFAHPDAPWRVATWCSNSCSTRAASTPPRYAARAPPRSRSPPAPPSRARPATSSTRCAANLPDVYDEKALEGEGLRIYSTLDLRLQQIATQALREGIEGLEKKYPKLRGPAHARLQGCLLALRPQTGEVLALVGGRDYGESQFDRCLQARRSAGSAFKPFVYIAGLESSRGVPVITLASTLDDAPLSIKTVVGELDAGELRPPVPRPRGRAACAREVAERRHGAAGARSRD